MDDNDVTQPIDPISTDAATQVMPPAGEEPANEIAGGEEPDQPAGPPSKSSIPRRWFAAAVIAVMLIAAGVGVYLGTRGESAPESEVAEVTETESEAEEIVVPDLRGMTLERATQDAEAAGLTVGEAATAVVDESVTPAGTVLSQDPLPGAKVAPGSEISLVIAEAPAAEETADGTSGGTSGSTPSGDSGGTPAEPPPAPEDVTISDIELLTIQPNVIDLGIFPVAEWTTMVGHDDTALQWQSATVTLGGGDKRILLSADGPNGYLVAVWSWDAANDTDWRLETITVSSPGGPTYEAVLDAPAGNHTFMVKSQDTSVLWTLTIQEKK